MGRGLIFKLVVLFVISLTGFLEAQPSTRIRENASPYLLPNTHPIKSSLDRLFSRFRVTLSLETLEAAGFINPKPRKFTKLIVTKHLAFPGYIFKFYVDAQRYFKGLREDEHWILRIQGAELTRQTIVKLGLDAVFKVPHKWMYELPNNHLPLKGYLNKYYILVEEDMDLISNDDNKARWASDAISQEFLDQFYMLLTEVGLSDCAKPDNAPFSIDGKIAFIDTETFHRRVNYHKLNHFLSKPNQQYWKLITQTKG